MPGDNEEAKQTALDIQVDGNHYKNMKIQPVEFCQKNKLNACESAVVKYICRHGQKGGRVGGLKDLNKVKHYVDLLIQLEYSDNEETNS